MRRKTRGLTWNVSSRSGRWRPRPWPALVAAALQRALGQEPPVQARPAASSARAAKVRLDHAGGGGEEHDGHGGPLQDGVEQDLLVWSSCRSAATASASSLYSASAPPARRPRAPPAGARSPVPKGGQRVPSTACSSPTGRRWRGFPTRRWGPAKQAARTIAPGRARPQTWASSTAAKQARSVSREVRPTTSEMRVASLRLSRPPLHHDAELLHPAVERLPTEAQRLRRPRDAALGIQERGLDAGDGRGLPRWPGRGTGRLPQPQVVDPDRSPPPPRTARCTRFCSSRTLPGQSWERRGDRAASSSRRPLARRNSSASGTALLRLCLKGGSAISTTGDAEVEAWRNSPRAIACSRSVLVAHSTRTSARRVGSSQPLELAALQHPQQLGTGGGGQVPDLVQEERAADGGLERPIGSRVAPV